VHACATTLLPTVTVLPQNHVLELAVIGLVLPYARQVPPAAAAGPVVARFSPRTVVTTAADPAATLLARISKPLFCRTDPELPEGMADRRVEYAGRPFQVGFTEAAAWPVRGPKGSAAAGVAAAEGSCGLLLMFGAGQYPISTSLFLSTPA
jgi:hypothetical protein